MTTVSGCATCWTMRAKLDLDILWKILKDDFPPLIAELEKLDPPRPPR